ncbi:UNVERIFIED_ORG: vanillate O-demethylase ferredoxin subunit [Paraburkholderia sediminicola]|nr:vanillate O-demethylase ferredoxin subunit [Paraburkholderia sediminicola]
MADQIFAFELVPVSTMVLPRFSAGAHIDVRLDGGIIRQYSLSNHPSERHRYVIGVLRDPASRGGSAAMHDIVEEGSILSISEPKNHFPLTPDSRHNILLAGGIGVTPVLSMARFLSTIQQPFEMHYAARTESKMGFREEIMASKFADRVHMYYSDHGPSEVIDFREVLGQPAAEMHLYVCGPKGFIDAALDAAWNEGWKKHQIHCEMFVGTLTTSDNDIDFQVLLPKSGRLIYVQKNEPITKALAAAGISIPISCEQGVCGTCATRVLDGIPDHRDFFLTDAEKAANDAIMPCCSRSKSKVLALDIE